MLIIFQIKRLPPSHGITRCRKLGHWSVISNRKECLVRLAPCGELNEQNNQLNPLDRQRGGKAVMGLDRVRTWSASGQEHAGIKQRTAPYPAFTFSCNSFYRPETVTTNMSPCCHLSIRDIQRSAVHGEWPMTVGKGQNIIRGFQVKCSILLLVSIRSPSSQSWSTKHNSGPSEHHQV